VRATKNTQVWRGRRTRARLDDARGPARARATPPGRRTRARVTPPGRRNARGLDDARGRGRLLDDAGWMFCFLTRERNFCYVELVSATVMKFYIRNPLFFSYFISHSSTSLFIYYSLL